LFDGVLVDLTNRRPDEPLAAATVPWQLVALLLCLATFAIVAAILYPDVFGAPFEQFSSLAAQRPAQPASQPPGPSRVQLDA
jgi:hypothetical protein